MMRSPNWSSKILKEETVTSTNDRLAELCQEKEIKEFTTLMAEYQTYKVTLTTNLFYH